MATRGSTDASDELFDYLCSPCNKKDRNSEAVKFCMDCQEYLCVACIEHHDSFSVLAGHTLVERSKFGNASRTDRKDLPSVPTERCKVHSLKLIDMYCADHNSVGCHVCFTIKHKPCQGIHYIPEYVQTTQQAENIRKIKEEIEKTISEMENALKRKHRDIEDNRKTKATLLEEIKAFRTEIDEALDRLEKASVAELEETYGKLDEAYRDELKNIQHTLDRLTACKAKVETSQKNPSQQFVNMKISESLIAETENNKTISRDEQEDYLKFERNSEILHMLQNCESLAKIPIIIKHDLYKVQSKNTYSLKSNDDKSNCDIWSSCILDSGDILLADYDNQNIKLVECENYKVRNSMRMAGIPRSVCKIYSDEAAVSCNNNTVYFVSTKNQFTLTRCLKFDFDCRGIAAKGDQLVICEDGKKTYIYTMNGERLKIIEKGQSGSIIFSYIRDISVCDDSEMIHVADRDLGLVTMDRDGNVAWKYSGRELNSAWGVCTDGNGNVFVTGYSSKNVIQIGSGGKILGEVVSKSHGLHWNRAVIFDRRRCKLIVPDGNELHVFHVQ